MYYTWQKDLFSRGQMVFDLPRKSNKEAKQLAATQAKLQVKNEVLSELMEEHLKLKKSLGVI